MIFYNWEEIYRLSRGSSKVIIDCIDWIAYHKDDAPFGTKHVRYCNISVDPTSFLARPKLLLEERIRWKDKDVAQYIAIASYRPVSTFLISRKNKRLPTYLIKPDWLELIKDNPLMRVIDDEVQFLYEENKPWIDVHNTITYTQEQLKEYINDKPNPRLRTVQEFCKNT